MEVIGKSNWRIKINVTRDREDIDTSEGKSNIIMNQIVLSMLKISFLNMKKHLSVINKEM